MFTHSMFRVMQLINTHKAFIFTLQKLDLLTSFEAGVLQRDAHSKILEQVRNLK